MVKLDLASPSINLCADPYADPCGVNPVFWNITLLEDYGIFTVA